MINKIKNFFFPICLSGELNVSGRDFIDVELGEKEPRHFSAHFIDNISVIPCNPTHQDIIRCRIKNLRYIDELDNDFYVLRVYWHVSGCRKVEWMVKF